MDIQKIDGPRQGPFDGDKVSRLMVLLHGLGADGSDLINLAPMLAPVTPETVFVSPNAPQACDFAPAGRQWFSMLDTTPEAMIAGIQQAAPILNAFLDAELARYGLRDDQMVLFGFSQGTIMALHVALRRPSACAAVIGFSGALVMPDLLEQEVVSRPPVLLIHGEDDQVVPFAALASAEAALKMNEVPVSTLARPGLAHGIDQEGLEFAAQGIVKHLLNLPVDTA